MSGEEYIDPSQSYIIVKNKLSSFLYGYVIRDAYATRFLYIFTNILVLQRRFIERLVAMACFTLIL